MCEYWKVVVDENNNKMVAKVIIPENFSVHIQGSGIVDCLAYHVVGFYRKNTGEWVEDNIVSKCFTFATSTIVCLQKGKTTTVEPYYGYGMHAFDSLDNPYLQQYHN